MPIELFEEAQALAHVGSYVSLLDGSDRILWSKELFRIFGLEPKNESGELAFDQYRALIHPDDVERVMEARRAACAGGTPYEITFRVVRADGTVRWVHSRASIVENAPGVPRRICGVIQDVTEQQRTLDELRASEASYRRIVETTHEGVWTIDAEGNTTFANARMAAILGYEPGEMLGRNVLDFYAGSHREHAMLGLADRRRGTAGQVEIACTRKDRSQAWVILEATPILDDAGRYVGALAMVTDVTERRRAQEALAASERARGETEAQLRQAQKMEAIGRLAGGVAHDFNNLLSVILSYTGLILEDLHPADPTAVDLAEVKLAAERAAGLTRQLLAFSRQQVLKPRVIDLQEIARGIEKMVRRLVGEDVRLVLDLSPPPVCVNADPGQMEQVLMNLAVNARDAMPSGGVLTFATREVRLDAPRATDHGALPPGDYVAFTVTDTGTGMDAATRARAFEPFFTTKSKDKGTGLGLSTVLGIVQQSGGDVSISSEPGEGARFEILLPRVNAPPVAAHSAPPVEAHTNGASTILLVEDEDQVRTLATTILRRHGYRVIEAQNGGEALILSEDHAGKIDLLLTDVVMPNVSGPRLAARLSPLRPDMRVLFMSGYTDSLLAPNGTLAPGTSLLQKPIDPRTLLAAVREALAGVTV